MIGIVYFLVFSPMVSILGKVYIPVIRKIQDYTLWLITLKQLPYAIGIDKPLALYRVRENSISSNKIEMLKWNWKLFYNIEIRVNKIIFLSFV